MKDTTEDFMEIAIAEARKGMNKGNRPFGSVIVKHGAVAARAHSTSLSDHDVTAHAELKAIRNFFKKTKTGNLKGCMIYATGEPCLMCSAAIALANISELTIAANSGDLPKGMASRQNRHPRVTLEHVFREYGSKVKVERGVLREKVINLYEQFIKKHA